MPDWFLLLLAAILNVIAMRFLALSLPVHWKQVFVESEITQTKQYGFRIFSSLIFFISLVLFIRADHPTIAVIAWVMSLIVSAIFIAMVLSRNARYLRFF